MAVTENFTKFCSDLKMSSDKVKTIRDRYHKITTRINLDFWNTSSETNNSLYVGSYGRGTEISTSDIDIIVQLPYATYTKFNNYLSNGQSALLQEVKDVLQRTYSTSLSKGDGQIISITFSDGIRFEIVPAFINVDNKSYTYPDSNSGGTWETTYPRSEIEAINLMNSATNKNLKRLCRMARAWKNNCNVPIHGIVIDTLAYKFIKDSAYKDKSYTYYDWMSRDFFKYLKNIDPSTLYWSAPGSNRHVLRNNDNFQTKALSAYNKSLEAIESEANDYTAKQKWSDIYGTKFFN
ncbi:MAG TPA: nucleotidyltransferase [Clostridium sp.]|uniref:SMODS domain-containing nucleotidyltransferase n=1 Tax=Clostridium sp. TaxID=1506 RepID=UPI002F954090